jgi:hypothetical protein
MSKLAKANIKMDFDEIGREDANWIQLTKRKIE